MKKIVLIVLLMLSAFITKAQTPSYLPLTAGSSNPLTGLLVTNVSNDNQIALNSFSQNRRKAGFVIYSPFPLLTYLFPLT